MDISVYLSYYTKNRQLKMVQLISLNELPYTCSSKTVKELVQRPPTFSSLMDRFHPISLQRAMVRHTPTGNRGGFHFLPYTLLYYFHFISLQVCITCKCSKTQVRLDSILVLTYTVTPKTI